MCDWAGAGVVPASPEYTGGILSCVTETAAHVTDGTCMCLSYAHIAFFILCYLSLTGLFNATKTFRVSYICLFFCTFVHQTQPTAHLCMLLPNCCGRRWITRGCSPVNAFERLGYSKCPIWLFAGPKDNLHIFKVIKAHIAYENVQIEYLNMYSGFSILPCREGVFTSNWWP